MKHLRALIILPVLLGLVQCSYDSGPAPAGIASVGDDSRLRRKRAQDLDSLNNANSARAYDSVNDTARFLAGLPGGRGSALSQLRNTDAWRLHRSEMDRMFSYFTSTRQKSIFGWQGGALGGGNFVFYPFGGPDYLYAHAFFPGANSYVLVGLEGANSLPSISSIPSSSLGGTLGNLRKSIGSALNYSYFITKNMRADLSSTRLQGTLPLIMVFMARTGHHINDVSMMDLGGAPGYKISARGPLGGAKSVYYFREDLSNGGLANGNLLRFVSSQGRPVTFLKSASYLLHGGGFSTIRNAILQHSSAVVTDPSGIPFRSFGPEWDITLYGNYSGTLGIFSEYYQSDLAAAYSSGRYRVKPLPFGVGYKQTCLIVARKGRF